MKPFTYERASTAQQAAQLAQKHPNAKFIAGGTNLLDLMKHQVETPPHLRRAVCASERWCAIRTWPPTA